MLEKKYDLMTAIESSLGWEYNSEDVCYCDFNFDGKNTKLMLFF